MEKRYQVFVSSTFKDLEDERQEVMHALLELDCIPSGMELFPAANETQWNTIKRLIDGCDYYILIIGGRYGSIGPEGISYTEMEYRYAIDSGKPTIAFLHRHPGKIIADKTENSTEGKEKLQAFRAFVEKKLCKHWDTAHELGSVVSRSLIQLIKSTPAVGWVRADGTEADPGSPRSESAPKIRENRAYASQQAIYSKVVRYIKGHEITRAIFLQYSGTKAEDLLVELMAKGAEIDLYVQSPEVAKIDMEMQSNRISAHVNHLSHLLTRYNPEGKGSCCIYYYYPRASLRGVLIPGHLLAIGPYIYQHSPRDRRFPNDKFEIKGHNTPGMLLWFGTPEYDVFSRAFIKLIDNFAIGNALTPVQAI